MTVSREMVSAGAGCAIANGCLNGCETTKVKLQLHSSTKPVYRTPTMVGVMKQIAQEEGIVRGLLMPGLSASLARSLLYGSYRVGLYPTIRDNVTKMTSTASSPLVEPTLHQRLLSGMLTGALGSMVSCPLDVVRTRMQADAGLLGRDGIYTTGLRKGKPVRYTGLVSTFLRICREEGFRHGLYRGASITVTRATLLNGSQLASYDTLKHTLKRQGWKEDPILHTACALASGIIAQTVVMPVDTMKSHMMLGKGWRELLEQTLVNKGPLFYFRGYFPACAGQGLVMVLQMPLIEEFRRILGVAAI